MKQMRRDPFKTDLSAPLMTDYSLSFSRELEWAQLTPGLPSSPHPSHAAGRRHGPGKVRWTPRPLALLHFST